MTPSRTTIRSGSPQSRHAPSTIVVRPGNTKDTATASNPHCAYQPGRPSTETRYGVGRPWNGANDAMRSVPGNSQFWQPGGDDVVQPLSAVLRSDAEGASDVRETW